MPKDTTFLMSWIAHVSISRVIAWSVPIFLLLAAPTWIVSWLVYKEELKDEKDQLHQLTVAKARALTGVLTTELTHVTEDVHFLVGSNELMDVLERPDRHNRGHLVNSWLHFTTQRQFYDQVRYIDERGHEIVRLNNEGGQVRVVPESELQDKNNRYYVTETLELPQGAIYMSPLDLNKEQGEVEIPHKPMVRIAGAVFDRSGQRRGIIVLNYLGARLLDQLDNAEYTIHGRYLLINSDGYYLRGLRNEDEWGFMFSDSRIDKTLRHDFPDLWTRIHRDDRGQYANEKGIFVYQRIRLLKGGTQHLRITPQDWTLVGFVSNQQLHSIFEPLRTAAIKLNALAALVLFLAAVLLSYFHQQRRQTLEVLRLSATAFETQEAIVITHRDGRLLHFNGAFKRITGQENAVAPSQSIEFLLAPGQDETLFRMKRKLSEGDHWDGELWIRHSDGTTHPTRQMVTAVRSLDGDIRYYVYRFFDITAELSAKKEMERLAITDSLTGLYNRRHFEKELYKELRRSRRFGHPLSVMLVDIDYFKRVNDGHGHAKGDEVLCDLVRVMRTRLRETDIIARWGGEEFIVLLPETHLDGARHLAETLREAVERWRCGGLAMTISIGVAEHGLADTRTEFFERLDGALYRAKRGGRNRVAAAENVRLASLS